MSSAGSSETANYLGSWLAAELEGCTAVTGEIDDEQRRERVAGLCRSTHRILVATDCLSEGVNLQEHFDLVVTLRPSRESEPPGTAPKAVLTVSASPATR